MSLSCHETSVSIPLGEDVFCGTREERPEYSAICSHVVESVPQELRRAEPCGDADGIDIHRSFLLLELSDGAERFSLEISC